MFLYCYTDQFIIIRVTQRWTEELVLLDVRTRLEFQFVAAL